MAKAFNLTAQINLQGPTNLKPIVSKIKRELGSISANLNLKIDTKASKGIDTLTNKVNILNQAIVQATRNSQDLQSVISSLSSSLSAFDSASKGANNFAKSATSASSTAKAIQQATTEMQEFGKQSALAVRRFAAFSVATGAIYALVNAVTNGARAFVEFDQQIIKLRQTTNTGAVGIKDLETTITNLAVNLGVSSEKLAQVAIVLAQAGLSAKDTKTALAALAKTELAPSFDNITDTAEGAIAAMKQFGIQTEDLEKALGSINAVAAAFAVESSDIVSAIQKAGGAFAASSKGVSEGTDALNEFVAVFTSVRATTRESAETIATGLRTIFTRIQRGSTIEFLRQYGVELTDLEGKFVGPFEAVKRLSAVLNQIDPRDLRFSQIVEELGGFRQISKVIPLIQQFQTAQDALKVAQRGSGSLAESQVTAQQSLANQLARVREEFLALVRAVGQSQSFQNLFKIVTGLTSGLIKLVSVFKPIIPILALVGGLKAISGVGQFASGFLGGIKKSGGAGAAGESFGESIGGATEKDRAEATKIATTAIESNTTAIETLTTAVEALTAKMNGSSTLNSGGKVLGFARGGSVPGSGRGDKIPAFLEPKEYVLNRKTVQRIGKSKLDSINYSGGGYARETKAFTIDELLKLSGSTSIKNAIGSTNIESGIQGDSVKAVINTIPVTLDPADFQLIWDKANLAALNSGRTISNYAGVDVRPETNRTTIRNLNNRSISYGDLSSEQKKSLGLYRSAESRWGVAYEEVLASKLKGRWDSASNQRNFPIDIIRQAKDDSINAIGEAKFRTRITDDADLVSKLLRWRIEQGSTGSFFKENLPDLQDLDVGLGRLEYFWAGDQKKQFYDWIMDQQSKGVPGFKTGGAVGFAGGSPGGVRLPKGRGSSRARGARDVIEPISTETYLKWAKGIYDQYDADPSLVMAIDPSGMRLPPEIAYANYLLSQYAFETGGAGLSVGKRFVVTPQDRITSDLKPFLVTNPSNPNELGFYEDIILPFMKAKAKSIAETSKLGRDRALAARESEISAYTNAESAISEFKKTGVLDLDPGIMSYISNGISNPDSLPLDSDIISSIKNKLTRPNVEAFQALTGPQKTPVSVQGQRTKLAEVFNAILETYGGNVSDLEIDNIIKATGKKLNIGGIIRNFRVGGIQEPISLEEAKQLAAQTIVGGIGGIDKADSILSSFWSDPIPADPKKPKKITRPPRAKEVLDAGKISEWNNKYSQSDTGREFLAKINEARQALYQAYIDKVNTQRGASAPLTGQQITQANQSGLLFGLAGMYGKAFPARKLELRPGEDQNTAVNKLKGPVDVSVVGAVLARNELEKKIRLKEQMKQAQGSSSVRDLALDIGVAPTRDSLSQQIGEKSSLFAIKKVNKQRAIQYVDAIAKSLDPSSGGSQIFLDFDKTLAFGADKIAKVGADGKPDYSAFSNETEIKKGLGKAKLSNLGTRLKQLVNNADQTQQGLGSQLLNRLYVVSARPPQTMDLIADWLSNQGLNIPSNNVVGVGGVGKSPNDIAIAKAEEILSRLSGDRSIFIDDDLRNIDTARNKGLRAVQYGASIDSKSIKAAQDREGTQFEKLVRENLPANLVKAMTSAQSGESIDYPRGLGDIATTWFNEPLLANNPTDVKRTVSGIGKIKSNIANYLRKTLGYKLGGQVYDLQPDTGLSDYEFNQLVKFGNTNDFTIDEFKKYLDQYLKQKKAKSDLRVDPMSLLRALTPHQATPSQRQMDLAKQLMGEPDPQYRPRKYAKGGHVNAMLTPGEAVIGPEMAKRIGYAKLNRMNQADRNGMGKFARGGGVSIVPGSGSGDTYGPVPLPVGSYVIRKKATEALGFNKGGSVGIQKFFGGGTPRTFVGEDRRLATLFKQLADNIRGGMTSNDAFARVAESARTDFPEAAQLLREAAEAFRSGADPKAVFAPFGGELARLAGDAFSSGRLDSDAFDELSGIVTKAADTIDLFGMEAEAAGSSLDTFQQNLKKRLAEQVLGKESQRRNTRIDLARNVIRSRSTDISDPDSIASSMDQLRGPLTALVGSLEGVDPSQIESTLQGIVAGAAAGQSLEELRTSLPLLNSAFDNTIDRATALAEVEADAADALGSLSGSIRSTIEEIDAIEYKKSGNAARDFGAIGEANPAAALAFRNSAVGGRVLRAAQSFQQNLGLGSVPVVGKALGGLNTVLGKLPGPIGNAVRAIGGLPGALAAVASIIGTELLPKLNEFMGLSEDPNAVGIAGGVAQGGSMAVSLGTIGQQVGGAIGGVVGTIGGAIAGFIKGYADSFRRQELTNALKGVTSAAEGAKLALDNLSKYDSNENARAVRLSIAKAEREASRVQELSQRTDAERRTDAISYGGIGAVIGTIGGIGLIVAGVLGAIPSLGASLGLVGAGAAVIGTSAVAGAAIGSAYGYMSGPNEMDNEALQAYLETLKTLNDTISVLAERDIKFKSLEELNQIIDGFKDPTGKIDNAALGRQSSYIQQSQLSALESRGYNLDPTKNIQAQIAALDSAGQAIARVAAETAAYEAGLEQLNRELGGNKTAIRAATDTEAEKRAIMEKGFERLGAENRQLALQQRLVLLTKSLNVETEALIRSFDRALAAIERYNTALNSTDSVLANSTDALLGKSSLNNTSRTQEAVLKNSRAYSLSELEPIFKRVFELAGGGKRASDLTDSLRGRKIVEDKLPDLLNKANQENIGEISDSIRQLFKDAKISKDVGDQLVAEISRTLGQESGSRAGKSFDELLRDFQPLQESLKTLEKANETAIALLEAQNNLYDKIISRLNEYGNALQKASEWARKAAEIQVTSQNDLAKALGQNLSLDALNKAFNDEIKALTDGLIDPGTIANKIRTNQARVLDLQQQISTQPATDQGRNTVLELSTEQEKLKRSSSNLYQALEKLATSGTNASNALAKLQERRDIGNNAADLLERVFTQGAEEADRMFRSFGALQDALSGNLLFGNQQERTLAFDGYKTLAPLLSGQIANELRALLLENMLKGSNISLDDQLIPAIGDQLKFTYRDIVNNLRDPQADPATKALIDSYATATQVMIDASKELSRLNAEAAENFRVGAENLLKIPFPKLDGSGAPGADMTAMTAMAADIRSFTQEALSKGSIYTHDTTAEGLLNTLVSKNNVEAPVIGNNNVTDINNNIFERIATNLPGLNTELTSVVNAFNNLDNKLLQLIQSIDNLINKLPSTNSTVASRNIGDVGGTGGTTTTINISSFKDGADIYAAATRSFGSYVDKLSNIKFPEQITMGGSFSLDVRVSGAAAFEALEEKTKNIINTEINNKLDELVERIAKSTGYAVDPRRRSP